MYTLIFYKARPSHKYVIPPNCPLSLLVNYAPQWIGQFPYKDTPFGKP